MAVGARAKLYEYGWLSQHRLPRPVISIGNLTVGGTGKTPFVMWVARWLQSKGKRPGILSRGYRRTKETTFLLVSDGQKVLVTPQQAGDEPFLMAKHCPGVVVAVGANRYELGKWLLTQSSVDCFILDDGYQHLGLYRDVNLLLVDGLDPQGLKKLLPAGRLREPLSAARRATALVVTRADLMEDLNEICQPLQRAVGQEIAPIQIQFQPKTLYSLSTEHHEPLRWVMGKRALIFSGIGNALAFRTTVMNMGANLLDEMVFPDHHNYADSDLETIRRRMRQVDASFALTTEKDAVKLAPLLRRNDDIWAIDLQVTIKNGEERLYRLLDDLHAGAETFSG